MEYDLVIKNGTVVDGSGLPRHRADVAIKDGKIVAKGHISGGGRVLDAEGKIVAPGFIDIHTHYDAQIFWDPLLTSSPWHGVTTVIMGNCGFTLAPCRPADRDYITAMFARVEGVNIVALQQGLRWNWETFPEYLQCIEQQPLGINVGTMVGHSAVRLYVMGEEALSREARADEVQMMKRLVRESLAAGAFGFTTSLSRTHYGGDGRPVPSRLATHDEVLELGSTLSDFGVGSIEIITETAGVAPQGFTDAEQELLTALSLRSGRAVNWNILSQALDRPATWRKHIDFLGRASKEGAQVYAVAKCQRTDLVFNLQTLARTFDRILARRIFSDCPTWNKLLTAQPSHQMELLSDQGMRASLRSEASQGEATTTEWFKVPTLTFRGSKSGKYTRYERKTLADISRETGTDAIDLLLDWSREENLEANFAINGFRNGDSGAVAQILNCPQAILGISDAGAHTDQTSGADYSTFALAHWVRDKGLITLEDAIRRMTFMPASLYGLKDRGLLREGMVADVVIFDLQEVNPQPAELLHDFPGGQSRMGTRAKGIDHLIVNGAIVFDGQRHTGLMPGKVIRSTQFGRG